MNRIFFVLAALILGAILYGQIKQDGVPGFGKSSLGIATYGERGATNTWPGPGSFDFIAEDLTAANYYLVVDGSGSMSGAKCADGSSKINVAKDALRQFTNSLPAGANLGLFAFDGSGISERVALSRDNVAEVQTQINRLRAGGSTPLGQSINFATEALTQQARRQLGYGEYHLVVITDGQASDEDELSNRLKYTLGQTPVVVHTIGFCIDKRHALNQPGYTIYRSANNPESLSEGLQNVLAEAPTFDVRAFSGEK